MHPSMVACQRRLALLWCGGAAVPFFLLFVQTVLGKFGSGVTEAWGWFSQALVPTLALIVGALVMEGREQAPSKRRADAFLFKLAFGLSATYLLVVLLTLLTQPFATATPGPWFKQSNLWLGLLQGIVSASLGAFFVKPGRT
jgi:hypothetical protein